mmetsp:Transcript_4482/g.13596  ORF Transcript_4482/g.13596 Transcript_4482/m.13596 type:complete len:95 (+) Transcript_4482:267-551(+)
MSSSARLLGLDTLWVARRLVVFGGIGSGALWCGKGLKRRLSSTWQTEGDKELEVECDCAPLWQCMTEPQPGQDCAKLESELRACMARATASRAS